MALTIGAKAAANGTIFGSVNNIQIAEALEKLGHNVDRKLIVLKEAVKELGSYTAKSTSTRRFLLKSPSRLLLNNPELSKHRPLFRH